MIPVHACIIQARGTHSSMKVLLTEDQPQLAQTLAQSLGALGIAVELQADGVLADAALHKHGYEVVILDLALPRMDGFEILRRLRHLDDLPPRQHDLLALLISQARRPVRKNLMAERLCSSDAVLSHDALGIYVHRPGYVLDNGPGIAPGGGLCVQCPWPLPGAAVVANPPT
jgi:DNA-binding response OmpR family regulator